MAAGWIEGWQFMRNRCPMVDLPGKGSYSSHPRGTRWVLPRFLARGCPHVADRRCWPGCLRGGLGSGPNWSLEAVSATFSSIGFHFPPRSLDRYPPIEFLPPFHHASARVIPRILNPHPRRLMKLLRPGVAYLVESVDEGTKRVAASFRVNERRTGGK